MSTKTRKSVELVEINDTVFEQLVDEFAEYRNIKKLAEEKMKELETAIRERMAREGATHVATGSHTVQIVRSNRTNFNKSIVEAENPELYARCVTTSETERFTVK